MANLPLDPYLAAQAAILEFGSVRKAASALNVPKSTISNVARDKKYSIATSNKILAGYLQLKADIRKNIDGGVRVLRTLSPIDKQKLLSKPKENTAALRIYKGLIDKHAKRRRLDKKLLQQLTGSFGY